MGRDGIRTLVIYFTEEAQKFVIDNMDAVIATEIPKENTSDPQSENDEGGKT